MKPSYTLLRNDDGTWRVEIPFDGRISVHQTKTKNRAIAEEKAKYRVKRLPIEDRAHKKFSAKRKAKKAAPARSTSPSSAPPIDAAATAAKLRALPVSAGAGDIEPQTAPDPPPQTPAAEQNEPAPATAGEAPPAPALPELPEAAAEPIKPELGDDRQSDDGEQEGQEFFADVAATAVVAGTVKLCHDWADRRDKVANEPSAKGLEWYQEGLQFRLRKLLGDASMGPNAKLFIGGGAVIMSMLWGCADKPGAAAAPPRARAAPEQPAAPAPAASSPQQRNPDRHPGADQGGEAFDEMALVKHHQQPRNGTDSASGRFR